MVSESIGVWSSVCILMGGRAYISMPLTDFSV
jgi:hypothetical protein